MYQVTDKDGNIVNPGDTVYNHRGEAYTLVSVSRPAVPGKSAKWVVSWPCECEPDMCDGWNWGHRNGTEQMEYYVGHGYTVTEI